VFVCVCDEAAEEYANVAKLFVPFAEYSATLRRVCVRARVRARARICVRESA